MPSLLLLLINISRISKQDNHASYSVRSKCRFLGLSPYFILCAAKMRFIELLKITDSLVWDLSFSNSDLQTVNVVLRVFSNILNDKSDFYYFFWIGSVFVFSVCLKYLYFLLYLFFFFYELGVFQHLASFLGDSVRRRDLFLLSKSTNLVLDAQGFRKTL